jgi:hypothetical protein
MNKSASMNADEELNHPGNLADAGRIYKGIFDDDPGDVDALNLFGVIMQAAAICEGALSTKSDLVAARANLASAMLDLGKHEEAVETHLLAGRGRGALYLANVVRYR